MWRFFNRHGDDNQFDYDDHITYRLVGSTKKGTYDKLKGVRVEGVTN